MGHSLEIEGDDAPTLLGSIRGAVDSTGDSSQTTGSAAANVVGESQADFGPASVPRRSTFYAEQRHRRRENWRLSAVCLVIAIIVGFMLSAILSPLLLAMVVCVLKTANHFGCPPSICAEATHRIDLLARHAIQFYVSLIDAGHGAGAVMRPQKISNGQSAFDGLLPLIPGMVAIALSWLVLRAIQFGAGMVDLIAAVGARPTRPDNLQERRLANIVEEIALAAGIPTPRVMIIDAVDANAVAVGMSDRSASVLVTSGLVDVLNREETEAVVAHAVASIVNGDLTVMQSLIAMFQSFGLAHAILDLPVRLSAWRAFGSFCRTIMDRHLSPASRLDALKGIEGSLFRGTFPVTPTGILLLPFTYVMAFQKMILMIWINLIFCWPLGLLWRTRRYLADSSAVALTRNPDALASALRRLGTSAGVPRGGENRAYLFVCEPHRQIGDTVQSSASDDLWNPNAMPFSLNPPIERRLRRLVALGAAESWLPPRRTPHLREVVRNLSLASALKALVLVVAFIVVGTMGSLFGVLGVFAFTYLTTGMSLLLGFGLLNLVLRM